MKKQKLTMGLGIAALAALCLTASPATASAETRHGGNSGRSAFRGGFHGGFHGGFGGRVFYRPYWGLGWGLPGYYGGYYGYSGYYPGGYGYTDANWASVKTDVAPEEARVYLDGQYIGTADDFDGFPDKLYLRPGRYRLEFRLNGYETKTIEVRARAGVQLKVDDKLRHGASARAQSDPPKLEGDVPRFFAKRSDREVARPYVGRGDEDRRPGTRDEDMGREGDMGREIEGRSDEGDDRDDRTADADRDADRDRDERPPVARPSEDWRRSDRRPDVSVSARPEGRRDRGRLKISVEPSDAVVYVDDRFVGSADEVSSMDRGIVVAPGKHTVTVSRPGYRDKSSEVTVEVGKMESVTISLGR
ncbi:MAG: PEGA domain-containing protein [Acidobacteriota bacterium]